MPKIARDYYYGNSSVYERELKSNIYYINGSTKSGHYSSVKLHKKKKKNPLRFLISCFILIFLLGIIFSYGINGITKTIFNPAPYKNITTDLNNIAFPLNNYFSNSWFLGENSLRFAAIGKNAQMVDIKENVDMPSLKSELLSLMEQYSQVKPAIYVWDYETQNYVDINASQTYSTASIIKIPVLIDLFKSIELNQLTLEETMPLTEYYRTEGSGSLQFKAANSKWTIDQLAERMITESDNSATNMLVARLGSMTDINQSMRDWGIENTEMKTWLPDLRGNNRTTAKDMAKMLYNIDSNEDFLTSFSRQKIFDYMSRVHNNRLIQAGLGEGSVFLHKTGDIGKMLGDAGIVITPNGAKYIVVILANRPHNSVAGKDFIVKASEIIYKYMVK